MLKRTTPGATVDYAYAATFGWLCVETLRQRAYILQGAAATFGWLCVETPHCDQARQKHGRQPPSGGCVLKLFTATAPPNLSGSHLRVAVC